MLLDFFVESPGRGAEAGGGVSLLELKTVSKKFGGLMAVGNMSFTLEQGEILGLIGPNGAGKTTVLDLICGKTKATSGSIRAFGEDLLRMADYKRARWGLRRTFQTWRQAVSTTASRMSLSVSYCRASGWAPASIWLRRMWVAKSRSPSAERMSER